ncbi:MAG: tetraacyldisaccharide 4'-kinase [Phycisphaerae bacterium]|nr:tetraacyldisaccharide 4'-kinase [Phycisphaerae bacterium]
MNQRNFHKLISGQSVGLTATLLRFSMRVAAIGYSLAVRCRNFLYSKQWLKIHTADMPVISIGNITTGGTGKTPLVIWICKFLQEKQISCAILTRGYKARGTKDEGPFGSAQGRRETKIDEPAVLAESCPQAKVIINPDRVAAAEQAVGFGAKALIMDDGFQHRRLHRDLDIVTIDATCPFGYGKLLPAGLLREPIDSLKRADAAVLTRCDQISGSELSRVKEELQIINSDMIIAKSIHKPVCAKSIDGEEIALEQLRGRKVFAFCGIGNPDAFLSTIKNSGAELVGSKIYDDHYHYTSGCLADIYEQACYLTADLILTTQKDRARAKMIIPASTDIPFAYLEVEIEFTTEEDKLKQLIEDALAGKIHRKY